MQVPISPKLREDVKKIMQKQMSVMKKTMKDFYNKKEREGNPLDFKALQKDLSLQLEFRRYFIEVMTS